MVIVKKNLFYLCYFAAVGEECHKWNADHVRSFHNAHSFIFQTLILGTHAACISSLPILLGAKYSGKNLVIDMHNYSVQQQQPLWI